MDRFVELARSRRSIRKFTGEAVPREDAALMIEAATLAPSGGNKQPWLFVAVDDKAAISKCRNIVEEGIENIQTHLPGLGEIDRKRLQGRLRSFSLFFSDAPMVVFTFVDTRVESLACTLKVGGIPYAEAEALAGRVELVSAAAAVENLLLAAHSMGYGACWMHPLFFAKPGIAAVLDVGDGYELMAIVPVGRPAERPSPPIKKPASDVVRFMPPAANR